MKHTIVKDKNGLPHETATFDDGSELKVPNTLWILKDGNALPARMDMAEGELTPALIAWADMVYYAQTL